MAFEDKYVFQEGYDFLGMIVYSAIAFFVPFFIGHPQLLVGVIVNAMLVMSALSVKGWKVMPVVFAPSLGALSRGVLFGPFSVYLLYFIPFIWIGNLILVHFVKHYSFNYWVKLILGSACKAGFLFLIAFVLFSLGLVPSVFLYSMGVVQLITALIGGSLARGSFKLMR